MKGIKKWRAAEVRMVLAPNSVLVPELAALSPELASYDQLLNPSTPGEEVKDVN